MLNTRHPDLPECAANIPAMTSEAERLAYYELALENADKGEIVELGAWLGASTAYIAAGIRDSGVKAKVHVYDRFVWKPQHEAKQRAWFGGKDFSTIPVEGGLQGVFRDYMGPLGEFVEIHAGEIKKMAWTGGEIALLVTDAPKRVPEISKVLTELAPAMRAGTVMAWQDFSHFASYDIVACLSLLPDNLVFVRHVDPGTTAIFEVTKPWEPGDVAKEVFALHLWTPDEIEGCWDAWLPLIPEATRARFSCGAALFMCDNGAVERAAARLRKIAATDAEQILPKWVYFRKNRPDLVKRYAPLFAELGC